MKNMHQKGYLMMVAAVFIVIIAFLGLSVAYMVAGSAGSTLSHSQGNQALDIAYGGLEKSLRYLTTPLLSGSATRISCSSVTSNAQLTGSALGQGTLTVTTVAGSPFFLNTTLSSAVTASSTSIPLTSVSGLSSSGRILIDNEAINYADISSNSLIGLTRGANGTLAASHASGAGAGQYLCLLQSAGGIPSVAAATWKRTLQQGVTLQQAWAVGALSGNNFSLTQWNRPTALAWNSSAVAATSATVANLNDVSVLGGEAWAVGDVKNSNYTFLHLINGSWSLMQLAGAASTQNLAGVSAVSATEAWAVGGITGSGSSKQYTVMKWNGSAWSRLSSPNIPANSSSSQNLNAVSVLDTSGNGTGDIGFAVGAGGVILKYNGSTWAANTSPTTNALNGVAVVSSTEAWAVGASGTILKWNGTSWATFSSPTTTALNYLSMLDSSGNGTADVGIAAGNNGVILRYNGSAWSVQTGCGTNNLFGASMITSNDAWVVGASGKACHWDGTAWTSVSSGVTVQLNGIHSIPAGSRPFSAVEEIFP